MTKAQLRAQMKLQLAAISFFELIKKSNQLSENFQSLLIRRNLGVISQKAVVSFYPFDLEPQLNIESEALNEPYRVAYVRIDDWKNRAMTAAYARRDQPGQWQEIEPAPGVKIFQPADHQIEVSEEELSIILVPGLIFSSDGLRVGRGAGFYDRFLKQHPHALRVGLAFQLQCKKEVPIDPWDEPLDMLLTDEIRADPLIFNMNRFGEWKNHGKVLKR